MCQVLDPLKLVGLAFYSDTGSRLAVGHCDAASLIKILFDSAIKLHM